MKVTAKVVPFSSVVGSSVMLHDESGKVVGQLGVMLTGGDTPEAWKAGQIAVAEHVAKAINDAGRAALSQGDTNG